MAKKREKALGKGLDDIAGLQSLFGDNVGDVLEDIQKGTKKPEGVSDVMSIALDKIDANPYQPRKEFDEASLKELTESIQTHGVFQPILVKKTIHERYQLIAGERRVRAARKAGLKEIPAILMDFNDQQMLEIALLENIQREDLNAIEEAQAYRKMIDTLHYTQEEVAQRIGKSREHVANTLRLLKLPEEVQDYVVKKQLNMGHVRALLALKNDEEIKLMAKEAIEEDLSVRQVEKRVRDYLYPAKKEPKKKDPAYQNVERIMEEKLQTKVSIDAKKITISYQGVDDLNRILEILDCLED